MRTIRKRNHKLFGRQFRSAEPCEIICSSSTIKLDFKDRVTMFLKKDFEDIEDTMKRISVYGLTPVQQ